MRRTITGLLSIAAICLAGIVIAQDSIRVPDKNTRRNEPAKVLVLDTPAGLVVDDFQLVGDFQASEQRKQRGTIVTRSEDGEITLRLVGVDEDLQQRIAEATKKLTSDDTEEQKQATAKLESAVTDLFERRAKTRQKEIELLEQRIAKLRDQMERREEKKSEIIQLQVQTYINQANGLGF